ncbi:MAG: double-strand break repair helicase AddA [Acetobacteraceae bacterium]|nr:double-strand break repair helicase AddA [Acetobacteraceae bacterium]
MSVSARLRANTGQLSASDPAVSAFVSASAGSGKTKLLTDRLLRLMLAGAEPGRIQCLTFTKAAAAEMALRLQRRLGDWVTLDDAALDAALAALAVRPDAAVRARARALFAEVLDLPGGMRIGTIHAFCQSLLRRFPLEAAISPHFQLMEDRDAGEAMDAAREAMLARARGSALEPALDRLAGIVMASQFGDLAAALAADRDRLGRALGLGMAGLADAQRRVLGVTASDVAGLRAAAATWPESQALRAAARTVAARGSAGCKQRAEGVLAWLGQEPARQGEQWHRWAAAFLKADGAPFADTRFVNGALHRQCPDLLPLFQAEAERIMRVEDACRAVEMASVSAALIALARPVIDGYTGRKGFAGQVDFADLIDHTSRLLVEPGAAWVLYKLDGGLDHLLLDEVQDTAPAQWHIAQALTAEFFAGAGSRPGTRTVFAVGDRKQSIFSFQGADIRTFDAARDQLGNRVRAAGERWLDTTLDVSFRSTAPVLALVDRVFAHPAAARGVVAAGQTLSHFADRAGHAGAVELWPLAPAPETPPAIPWSIPDEYRSRSSSPSLLADALAGWIAGETAGGTLLESRGRPLAPGDVMVLVRRRGDFPRALVRALKTRNVPVAGLDRLVLTDQPAVQDLVALGETLLLPEDDLSLACVLTSPLGGLGDDDLMALAAGREGSLWQTLRARRAERPGWEAAVAFLSRLLSRVDYVSPHAILAEALGPLGGRVRLLARLGPEAAEPVDELLQAAIVYGRSHPVSLQGFLHWLRAGGTEVKREPEAAGNAVRIMTVHAAKGLQAPLVIVPDTTALPKDEDKLLWAPDPESGIEVPLWVPRKEFKCQAAARLRDAAAARRTEEYNRLLYVALTRAEDRLVVCGWQPGRGEVPPESWYGLVRAGFAGLETGAEPWRDWGERLVHAAPQAVQPERPPAVASGAEPALPAWAGAAPDWRPRPAPAEPHRPQPLAPSRPDGALLGPVPYAASPLGDRADAASRFRRGEIVHALLQHLPSVPPVSRSDAVLAWLNRAQDVAAAEAAVIAREVLAILDDPELRPLFGPGSRAEVPLTGYVDGVVIGGVVDRLAVLPERVLIADFKTSRSAPAAPDRVPLLYLRQMAAYRGVLRGIFPTRPVLCALIWTAPGRVTVLPDALLDLHAPGTAEQTGVQGVLA